MARRIGRLAADQGCASVLEGGDVLESIQGDRKLVARSLDALGSFTVHRLPGRQPRPPRRHLRPQLQRVEQVLEDQADLAPRRAEEPRYTAGLRPAPRDLETLRTEVVRGRVASTLAEAQGPGRRRRSTGPRPA